MVKLGSKIKSSTLIEVIVSLLIIIIIYAILVLFIQNISKQIRDNNDKIKAYFTAENILSETKEKNQFINDAFEKDNSFFEKTVENYKNYKDLYIVKISAHNKSKKLLFELKEVIYVKKNQ